MEEDGRSYFRIYDKEKFVSGDSKELKKSRRQPREEQAEEEL